MRERLIMETKKRIIKQMKSLGVYNGAYDDVISVYADLLDEYEQAKDGNAKAYKIADLRKLIKQYAETLRLTPKTYKDGSEDEKPKSKLEEVFNKIAKFENCG